MEKIILRESLSSATHDKLLELNAIKEYFSLDDLPKNMKNKQLYTVVDAEGTRVAILKGNHLFNRLHQWFVVDLVKAGVVE